MVYIRSRQAKARYGDGICSRKSQKSTILNRPVRKGFKEKTFEQKSLWKESPG